MWPIQETFKQEIIPFFIQVYLLCRLQWELANEFDQAGFLTFGLVTVSRDFQLH